MSAQRPLALITGASRRINIGAAIARALARSGWDVATTFWRPYDATMPWGSVANEAEALADELQRLGARSLAIEADLADAASPARLFDQVEGALGPVTALVLSHCQSVDSAILDTTVESFDLHMAINARATWLLVREFGQRFRGPHGAGRIIAITSDHTAFNLPYGASKGALERIVLAAAREFAALGVTANVINPGAVDTGWMSADFMAEIAAQTPLGRVGQPQDTANLASFLCSPEGGWINGQIVYSNGGVKGPAV
jgi:3-oxoacyl-[acyl-carrier protein] reductase